MSIPFSRSMRVLHAESSWLPLAWLLVAIVLLIAWMAWFCLVQMTLYERGQIVGTSREGTVVADFPPQAWRHIRRGQSAFLIPQSPSGDRIGPFSARVMDVTTQGREGRVRVELYPQAPAAMRIAPRERLTGQVEVAVDHMAPATLLRRAPGKFFDIPRVSLSPQPR